MDDMHDRRRTEVFILTPLANFLSPVGALTSGKYDRLMAVTGRFASMLRHAGYEVSSIAEMADLGGFDDSQIVSALQDACFMDSFMANVRAQIDNCECVTTIPVNMMADELVDMLKAEYMDRYVPLSRLLGIGADEAARIVQAILDGSKAVQRRKIGQKRRIHRKGHDISDRKPEKESRPDHPALA